MVGSSDSIASPNTVLNTIVAEAFAEACDEIEKSDNMEECVHDLIKKYLTEHQRVVFNGNGYSQEWVDEAKRRGLPNLPSMVDAIPALVTDKSIKLFGKFGIYTEAELRSRAEIQYEAYAKAINIEARTMIDIAAKTLIPSVVRYSGVLADTVNSIKAAGSDTTVAKEMLDDVIRLVTEAKSALTKLIQVTDEGVAMEQGRDQAVFYKDEVNKAMNDLRRPIDELETIMDKDYWPMPSYGDLLFEV